jgi:single-strand DNA-binding protein
VSRAPDGAAPDRTTPRNEVVLVGRVPAAPQERVLPSGDVLVTWRVVVARPPARTPPPEGVRTPTVDTLDCVAWTAPSRRAASALVPDDVVEVSGALRRRFWRAGAAAASRCEVEVSRVRRVSRRTARGPGAAPG